MDLPYFFVPDLSVGKIILPEDTSKHLIAVLRKNKGDQVQLTNGKGKSAIAVITDDNRKRSAVLVNEITEVPETPRRGIAISLIKNSSRFEWFLEKATEIGITEIIPLICDRTEKEHFRHARMEQILVSAMLQSQQCWLPKLSEPVSLKEFVAEASYNQKFIAHCLPLQKNELPLISITESSIVLIGPEGDFTESEIERSINSGYMPVSLGNTRLRTETAGITAAVLLCISDKNKL